MRARLLALVPAVFLLTPACHFAETRVDRTLAQMAPSDAVSLLGARMDQLKDTPLFQRMLAAKKLPQMDEFATQYGFDPRRDIRELLVASNGEIGGSLLLARGTFGHADLQRITKDLQRESYQGFTIYASRPQLNSATPRRDGANREGTPKDKPGPYQSGRSNLTKDSLGKDAPTQEISVKEKTGFCLLDDSTLVAGTLPAVHAALDRRKSGDQSASDLMKRAQAVPMQYQLWAISSSGAANWLARSMPQSGNSANFAHIFRRLGETTFEADLRQGLDAFAEGYCATEQDAKSLGDAARGLVGLGRLSVPDKQPELLKLWDGVQVDQVGTRMTIHAKIPQNLIDKFVEVFQSGQMSPPKSAGDLIH